MIDTFFKQTNETIWGFLQEIGKSKEVFSCYSFREIDGYTLFFYATSTEIVLVLLDIVDEGTVEYAEDDSRLIFRNIRTIQIGAGHSPDVSYKRSYRKLS